MSLQPQSSHLPQTVSNVQSIPVPAGSHPHTQKLHDLQIFLNAAPALLHEELQQIPPEERNQARMKRFLLPSGDYISCIWWDGIFHITGTDVVRSLVFRFEVTGRPVRNLKKFEEGVFSDLRNLKPGVASVMEEAKSPFLDLLFRHQCIRTQKKQKVFYWFEVDHDRLYLDALDRDLKREKLGMEPTTGALGAPPAFDYDPRQSLSEQFIGPNVSDGVGDGSLERTLRHLGTGAQLSTPFQGIDNGGNGSNNVQTAAAGFQGPGTATAASSTNTPPAAGPSTSAGGRTSVTADQDQQQQQQQQSAAGRKRFSDGQLASGSQSPADRRREYEEGPSKRRRANDEDTAEGQSPPLSRSTPQGHHPNYQSSMSSSSRPTPDSSRVVSQSSAAAHSTTTSSPADAAKAGAAVGQPRSSAEVRVVLRPTPEHYHGGGGNAHLQMTEQGTHGAAAEENMRLTCPVPICRQEYVGKQTMLSHMRTHNEQDWKEKENSQSSSSLSYSVQNLYRSPSADMLNANILPANLAPSVPNPSPSFPPNHPLYAQPNYPSSAGPSRVSTPQNGVLNSSSSLHGATVVGTAGAYSHSQNGWSPAPSSLSLESAPLPRPLTQDQYTYAHRQSLNDNFPITARSTYSSAGSTHSADHALSTFDRIPNHPLYPPQESSGVHAQRIVSTSSAPPHRSKFVIGPRDDTSAMMTTTSSWGGEGSSSESPRTDPTRRFQSEAPRPSMSVQGQISSQRSPYDQIGASLQPPNRLYSSPTSNVRQSTPDNGAGASSSGGHIEMLAKAASTVGYPSQGQQQVAGGGSGGVTGGSLGIPHFEARPASGLGLRYATQSVPAPPNGPSYLASSQAASSTPRGYGSSTSPSSLSGAILAPGTSSRASSVVSGSTLTSSPAYHPPAPAASTSPTPQALDAFDHSTSGNGYGRGQFASFAV